MEDYRVDLDVYHGPLDLLLYLIRRDELDIHDIPIARVTHQYLAYVETLKNLDINDIGDFLVMAASLMEIKSAMLARDLGAPESELATDDTGGETSPEDPRYELVQQLLAYKRFKDAATALDRRRESFAARFPRHPAKVKEEPSAEPPPLDLDDVSVWDLLESFTRLMEQVGGPPRISLVADDTPIELHHVDIVDRLQREGPLTLKGMFSGRSLNDMIGLFIATLELIRQRRVKLAREEDDEVQIAIRPDAEVKAIEEAESAAVMRPADPNRPDDFDWPDEQQRKRYARRIERRLRGEVVEEDEELESEIAELEAEENAPAVPPPADPPADPPQ